MSALPCQTCDAEAVKPCAYCPLGGDADLCPEERPAAEIEDLLRDRPSHRTEAPPDHDSLTHE